MEVNKIINGDCIEVMKNLPNDSVDAIITDPPYGLEFMGKDWDKFKETGKSHTMYDIQQPEHTNAYKNKGFKVLPRLGVNNNHGRFPANIIFDEESAEYLGEPSRFFYVAKTSKSERNYGLDDFEDKTTDDGREVVSDRPQQRGATNRKNNHPTVKPIKLMEYLIKLVTKKDAVVLDPFLGSGTTGIACVKTNRQFIGIEKESEYVKIAENRIKPYLEQTKLNDL